MNRTLILGAHGPETPQARTAFARLVNAVRREAQDLDVVDAFVDVQEPCVAAVVDETSGPRVVVPMMLAHDGAIVDDIAHASRRQPSVTIAAPLGPDWVLAELGVLRLVEAGARAGDTIVLAAGGSPDGDDVADFGKAARLLSAVWGGPVHVGTLGGPDTSLADAVDVARAYGRRVVVSSYVLTPGTVHDRIVASGADVVTAPMIVDGPPDRRLAALVVARARACDGWSTVGRRYA